MTVEVLGDEHRAFLARARQSFLFANRRDGSPTGWPMTPLWRDDGFVYLNTYASSAKTALLQRDPRIAMVLMHADRALGLTGDASIVDAADLETMVDDMVRDDGFLSDAQAERVKRRLLEGKRCVFRILPRSVKWVQGDDR